MNATAGDDIPALSVPPRRGRLPRLQELGLVIVILLMGATLSIFGYARARPGEANTFLRPTNLVDGVATPMSYYAIMAVGMTLVIVSGGIDISVGSIMALSALGGAWALQALNLCPSAEGGTQAILAEPAAWKVLPVAIGAPILIGLLCGLLNGLLIVLLRLHPFIVTLGTMSVFRGITVVLPPSQELPTSDYVLPAAFTDHFMQWHVGNLQPMPMIVMLLVAAVGWVYLSQMVGGREIYAVGGNEEAARFSGLRVNAIKLRVYVLMGLTAGIAGMVSLGNYGGTSTSNGDSYELTVIAAAVVGGASLTGGRGTAIGALLGTLIIALIQNAILILGWNTNDQKIIVGSAIVVAAAIDRFSVYLSQRRLAGAKRV